ncbi:hypothetical protein CYMTET_21959 [Cymbomonas tetramitiformis]|nr:hypothetical protein CYMTET_21959 [Cymbomonas tetramitiformis]
MGARGRGKRPRKTREQDALLLAQGKGPVKRTQQHPFDSAGSDDRVYVVEDILATRTRYSEQQWLIKWQDLPNGSETWEPLKNIPGYEAEIESFKVRHEREQAEIAKKTKEAKTQKRKERSEDGEDVSEDGFQKAPANLRSPYWRHFRV